MVGLLREPKDDFYDRLHRSIILPSSIVEFYPDATLIIDDQGKVIAWNKAMEKMTGVGSKDMLGKGNYEYAIPFYGERKPMLVDMVGLPREEISDSYMDIVIRDDKLEALTIKAKIRGRDVVLWGAAARLYGLDGKPVGAIESIRDVTPQKLMEEKLKESEEKYRLITTSTNDGIITLDMKGIITYINPSGQQMLCLDADHIIGRHFTDFVAEGYKEKAMRKFCRGMEGESIAPFEIQAVDDNGRHLWVELSGSALDSGANGGAIVAIRDVSERWKARMELKKAHEELERRVGERTAELSRARSMLQAVLDTIPAAILVADAGTGQVSYSNKGAVRIFGDMADKVDLSSERRPYMLLRPDGSPVEPRDGPLSRSLFRGEYVSDEEILVRHCDGMEISALISSAPVLNNGRIVGAVASAIDITERKRIESALRESEEKFRVLAETTSSAIFIYQNGRFRYVNPATEKITGYSKEELLSMNFWDWVHPDFRELVKNYGRARRHGKQVPWRYEIRFVTKDGGWRWGELIPGLIEYEKKPATLVTAMDITERKNAEEALKDAKEQAELYLDLMGHDINNMNQVAMGYLEMAIDTLKPDEPASAFIGRSLAMLCDSSRLIDNLRKVQQAVGKKLKLEKVDLDAILSQVKSEYSLVPGRKVTIYYKPAKGYVMANQLLKDVFLNIVGNAIKHSVSPINVAIRVSRRNDNGTLCHEISVEDDGPGIPDEVKRTLFTRMTRGATKAGGSGLGLYLVRSLVESFSGRVWAEDRVAGDYGKGCRFVVVLPAVD